MSALTIRKFYEEILQFVGKKVSIETSYDKNYSGTLSAIDERLDTVLENVEGQGILRIIINGSFVKEIKAFGKSLLILRVLQIVYQEYFQAS